MVADQVILFSTCHWFTSRDVWHGAPSSWNTGKWSPYPRRCADSTMSFRKIYRCWEKSRFTDTTISIPGPLSNMYPHTIMEPLPTLNCGNDALIQKCLVLPASYSNCSIIVVQWEYFIIWPKNFVTSYNLPRSNLHSVFRNPDEIDVVSQSCVAYSSEHSSVIPVPSNDVTKWKWRQ